MRRKASLYFTNQLIARSPTVVESLARFLLPTPWVMRHNRRVAHAMLPGIAPVPPDCRGGLCPHHTAVLAVDRALKYRQGNLAKLVIPRRCCGVASTDFGSETFVTVDRTWFDMIANWYAPYTHGPNSGRVRAIGAEEIVGSENDTVRG